MLETIMLQALLAIPNNVRDVPKGTRSQHIANYRAINESRR